MQSSNSTGYSQNGAVQQFPKRNDAIAIAKPVVIKQEELDHICRLYKLKADAVRIDMSFKHLGDSGAFDIAKFI